MSEKSSYQPEYVDQVRKICALGATDAEVAEFFGVSVRTIHRWKLVHDDFCQALTAGKAIADDRVERSLYQKATGYDYTEQQAIKLKVGQHEEKVEVVDVTRHSPSDTTAAIFWLKNRRPDDWREKTELAVSHTYGDLSDEELDRELVSMLGGAAVAPAVALMASPRE